MFLTASRKAYFATDTQIMGSLFYLSAGFMAVWLLPAVRLHEVVGFSFRYINFTNPSTDNANAKRNAKRIIQ